MIISKIEIQNWRNFRHLELVLKERQFVVGANASGKSNLLDVFRFLRDIAKSEGGGLQKAVHNRGGISKIRCLAARKEPDIGIDITLSDSENEPANWRYSLGIKQEQRGFRQPFVSYERVWRDGVMISERPDEEDTKDTERLKQTHLEQVNTNKEFREVAEILGIHNIFACCATASKVSGDRAGRQNRKRPLWPRVPRASCQGRNEDTASATEKDRGCPQSRCATTATIAVRARRSHGSTALGGTLFSLAPKRWMAKRRSILRWDLAPYRVVVVAVGRRLTFVTRRARTFPK